MKALKFLVLKSFFFDAIFIPGLHHTSEGTWIVKVNPVKHAQLLVVLHHLKGIRCKFTLSFAKEQYLVGTLDKFFLLGPQL